jgi:DHA2 family multidrug resistance protein-like MFS transporter
VGPLLGEVMLRYFWWGSVFLLAVPVIALLLVVGPLLLPEYRNPVPQRLDLTSAGLSTVAVLSLIHGINDAAQDGLGCRPLASLAIGCVVGRSFLRRQRRLAHPLVDLAFFRVPALSAALATLTLVALVLTGCYLLIDQYLQLVAGFSPLRAGVWTLPSSVGFVAGSTLTPVVGQMRPALLMSVGPGVTAVGCVMLTQTARLGAAGVAAGFGLMSLGIAPVFTLGTDLVVGAAPPEGAGAAAALAERLPPGSATLVLGAARRAFTHALQVVAAVGAALTAASAALLLVSDRRAKRIDGGQLDMPELIRSGVAEPRSRRDAAARPVEEPAAARRAARSGTAP